MKRILLLLATIGTIFGIGLTTAPAASAATKTVTIEIGDWNCMAGGRYSGNVSRVLIDAIPSTSGHAVWNGGRTRSGINVTYAPSGSKVTVVAVAFCKTSWWGGGYYREISVGRWVTSATSNYWVI